MIHWKMAQRCSAMVCRKFCAQLMNFSQMVLNDKKLEQLLIQTAIDFSSALKEKQRYGSKALSLFVRFALEKNELAISGRWRNESAYKRRPRGKRTSTLDKFFEGVAAWDIDDEQAVWFAP